MPKTAKGRKIHAAMVRRYGKERGEKIFHASKNAGTIKGVDKVKKAAKSKTIKKAGSQAMKKKGSRRQPPPGTRRASGGSGSARRRSAGRRY